MPDFRNMTLPEMVRHEGFTCTCGREHICPLDYLNVGRGILHELPDMLKAMGTKYPFVICDDNTYAAAGKLVCEILEAASIPHQLYIIPCQTDRLKPAEWEVGSVIMHYDPACDLILGVGSGVVNDICKVVAHAVGRKKIGRAHV